MPNKIRDWVLATYISKQPYQVAPNGSVINVNSPRSYNTYVKEKEYLESSNGRDGKFRNCLHTKTAMRIGGLTEQSAQFRYNSDGSYGGVRYNETSRCFSGQSTQWNNFVSSRTISTLNVDWNALAAEAVDAMLPSLQGPTNLVNFVIELKDFKRLGQALWGRASNLKKAADELLGFRNESKLGKTANAYLQWKFAWQPLFNDAVNLINSMDAFRSRLRELERRAGTLQQRYWGRNLSASPGADSTYLAGGYGSGIAGGWSVNTNWRIQEYGSTPIRYSATMRYRYTFPNELRYAAYNRLDGYMDFLGVNANPATYWNAIPFTFIVDWVVDVGSYLSRLRVDNIDLRSRTEILDFCHSVKGERRFRFQVQPCNSVGASSIAQGDYYDYATAYSRYYRRRVTIPNILGAISISGLNGTEVALSGALLTSKYTK